MYKVGVVYRKIGRVEGSSHIKAVANRHAVVVTEGTALQL